MHVLFIGDVVGRPGRKCVAERLPALRKDHAVDIVIANAENSAGGLGATPECLNDLMAAGVDAFTLGNHTWRKKAVIPVLESWPNIVRPANYPPGTPGRTSVVLSLSGGRKLGLLNLLGRIYMEAVDCPFRRASEEIDRLREQTNCILVDMHAEATSEKMAMGWHLDGRCSAIIGTHTHVQTADAWILPRGTGFITDAGMCGPQMSILGVKTERALKKFTTAMPSQFDVAAGSCIFSAVFLELDDTSGATVRIEPILIRDPA